MVHYKLYYFPFKGLGEGIRLLLNHIGVEFENCHVSVEEWITGGRESIKVNFFLRIQCVAIVSHSQYVMF